MGSLDKRIEALERLYDPGALLQDEGARRQRAVETLAELGRGLEAVAAKVREEECRGETRRKHALEEYEEVLHRRNTIRDFYRDAFGPEVGDEEYEKREALRVRYGAVALAPRSDQERLRKFG